MTDDFVGLAVRATPEDHARAAQLIGCSEHALRAVMHVETNGCGFDTAGRPKMLFEPHIFYRRLSAVGAEMELAEAIRLGIAYMVQGTRPYPGDSYPSLKHAMALDREAAMLSASWGIGQIMGMNCRAAGCETVQIMVEAAADSEAAQIDQMARFIAGSSALRIALCAEDWMEFADRYNGPLHRAAYGGKLALAYASFTTVV